MLEEPWRSAYTAGRPALSCAASAGASPGASATGALHVEHTHSGDTYARFSGCTSALGRRRSRVRHAKHKQKCSIKENSQDFKPGQHESAGRRLEQIFKTFNNGSLGSRIDEERSEMRYVVWIAEFRESSNLWTHIAPLGIPGGMPVWASFPSQTAMFGCEWYSEELAWKCWPVAVAAGASYPATQRRALLDVFVLGSANSRTAGGGFCGGSHGMLNLRLQRDSSGEECSFKFDLKSGRSTRWT